MLKSFSFWIGNTVILMVLLQWMPPTAFIFSFLGLFGITALLINLLAFAIFIEAVSGKIPAWLIALPALYFGSYYVALAIERGEYFAAENALRAQNAQTVVPLDIDNSAVVVPIRYRMLPAQYGIEAVYVEPQGYGPFSTGTTFWTPMESWRLPFFWIPSDRHTV